MRTRVLESINDIPSEQWNTLLPDSNPFIRHEFLAALEDTGCASVGTGWQPMHIACEAPDGQLIGALPLYLKSNSYGEFVFDFSWANAYHQAGLSYYPKLVSAIPFTPASGPRLLASSGDGAQETVAAALLDTARELASLRGASSLHILFPDPAQAQRLKSSNLLLRKDCQFHWHNQQYADFDEFLDQFTAEKRKKTRRERRRVQEAGITFRILTGKDLAGADWDEIMPLYSATFTRRGRPPYLNQNCLVQLAASMANNFVMFLGYALSELVAVAICFRSDSTLYGRYWGATRFIDSLHFETCYYQGIEFCIREGLRTFEPGTQGEHKIARGFVPTETWSAHWLSHPEFARAIDAYLDREREHIENYIDAATEHVPYRRGSG